MEPMWSGDVTRISARQALTGDLPESRPPAEVFASSLETAQRELALADVAAHRTVLLQDTDVQEGLDEIARAAALLVRTRLRFACEVVARGLHLGTGFRLNDWLAQRSPDLDAPVVRDLARVATAAQEPMHGPLVRGVLSGGMPLARAARMHRALQRIRSAIPAEEYEQAVQLLADAGCDPRFADSDIDKIISALLRACLPEKDHEARRKAQHQLRNVYESSLADGSVRRLIVTFGDDADYAAVKAILESPLSAPASKDEQEATGEVETRTAGQRRYDALMTVLTRGVAGSKGQPTTPKAALVVSLDYETLKRQLLESGGDAPGCGTTLDGVSISAQTIRRLACEADIIPIVLGGPSEILDQGRRRRLVTPGQRLRLAIRDGGCTIPGCSVPAGWCDAHHVLPWSLFGPSDLGNYALLCPRHHTWVHDHGLTATVDNFGVTWHLR